MSHVCRDDMAGFDRLLRLPAGDPERTAVEDCPRCGSRFLEYGAFLRADALAGANADDAQRRLSGFIESEAAKSLPRALASKQSWWSRSAFRWAVPVAAALTIAALAVWQMDSPDREENLRDDSDAETVALLPVRVIDGGVELAWETFASADAYQVRVLGDDLAELRRAGPVTTTTLRLTIDSAGERYYQVLALVRGDEIAASPIRRLSASESP